MPVLAGQRRGEKKRRRRVATYETQKNSGLGQRTLLYSATELIHMLASFNPFTMGDTRTSG